MVKGENILQTEMYLHQTNKFAAASQAFPLLFKWQCSEHN